MTPRKCSQNKVPEQNLINFENLADILHQKIDIAEKVKIIEFLRNTIRQYLACTGIKDENAVRFKMTIANRDNFSLIFTIVSNESEQDNVGTMFFVGAKIKGLPKNMQQAPKTFEDLCKTPLVDRVNIKLSEIDAPKRGKYKVHPKMIHEIISSPQVKFDIEI